VYIENLLSEGISVNLCPIVRAEVMAKNRVPTTQAIRALKKGGVDFSLHSYEYKEKGGTSRASQTLNVDEGLVIKTLVMEREKGDPFFILMHGDRNVSTKALARALGVKKVRPCDPQAAHRHTGYIVGGIKGVCLQRSPQKIWREF
jgi:Cys-tRNA(Pro) deacylase